MADTTVSEAVCELCGAAIRDGSLFCYNCGNAVVAKAPLPVEPEPTPEVPVAVPTDIDSRVAPARRPPLKSAASLRSQRRASNRQPIEVTWEPRVETPKLFVVATIVLSLVALALLLIALYLR